MSSRQRDYYIGYCTPYGSGFVFKFTPLSLNMDYYIQTLAVYFEFDYITVELRDVSRIRVSQVVIVGSVIT